MMTMTSPTEDDISAVYDLDEDTPEAETTGADVGFDFSVTETEDAPATMTVTHPQTGEPLDGLVVKVWGPDSPRMKLFETQIADKRIRRVNNTGKLMTDSTVLEKERLARVQHCIAGWEGFVLKGQAVEFTPTNVRDFITNFPWFRDQVDTFYQSRANFFRGTGKESTR